MGPIETIIFVATEFPIAVALYVLAGTVVGTMFPSIPNFILNIFKKKETTE